MITAPHILIPDCSIPISLVAPGTDTITAKTLPHATISRRPYHPTSGVCLTFPPCRSGAAAMLDGSQKATHDKRTLGEGGSAVSASSAVLCRGGSGYSLHTLYAFVLLFLPCSYVLSFSLSEKACLPLFVTSRQHAQHRLLQHPRGRRAILTGQPAAKPVHR